MRKRFQLLMCLTLLCALMAPHAFAATVHGTIYDLSLQKVTNALVEVNTTPHQRFVAVDGTYSFTLPRGRYLIKTTYADMSQPMSAQEELTIAGDGDYILDLFLYPEPDAGSDLNDSDILDINQLTFDYSRKQHAERQQGAALAILGACLALAIILFAIFLFRRRRRPARGEQPGTPPDLGGIISLLERNGGRLTQKELRKEIPMSEAKISLMVSELEHKGIIKKIKRGRANIIIRSDKKL